jgi:hypothetical protein
MKLKQWREESHALAAAAGPLRPLTGQISGRVTASGSMLVGHANGNGHNGATGSARVADGAETAHRNGVGPAFSAT